VLLGDAVGLEENEGALHGRGRKATPAA
jgi:hypothetical protein